MRIAIDWDDTFTEDPPLWINFINDSQSRGHVVYIVTARNDFMAEVVREELFALGLKNVQVLNTTFTSKKEYVRKMGVHIDIWIDDSPNRILVDEVHDRELYALMRQLSFSK